MDILQQNACMYCFLYRVDNFASIFKYTNGGSFLKLNDNSLLNLFQMVSFMCFVIVAFPDIFKCIFTNTKWTTYQDHSLDSL